MNSSSSSPPTVNVSSIVVVEADARGQIIAALELFGAISLTLFYTAILFHLFRRCFPKKSTPKRAIVAYSGIAVSALGFESNFIIWFVTDNRVVALIIAFIILHAYIFFAAMTFRKEYYLRVRFWQSLGLFRELLLIFLCLSTMLLVSTLPIRNWPGFPFVLIYHFPVFNFIRMTWLVARADQLDVMVNFNKVGVMRREGLGWVEVLHEKKHVPELATVVIGSESGSGDKQIGEQLPEKKPIDNFH